MRRLFIAAVLLCLAGAVPGGGAEPSTADFRVVGRIEEACRIGVEKAESGEDALASLRWRNGALAGIVEISYQATLTWLSERPDLAETMEREQALWLDGLESMPSGTREELERKADYLHRRLAVFMTITEGEFATGG